MPPATPNVASRGTSAVLETVKLDSATTPHPHGWPRRKLDQRSPIPFKKKPRETSKRPKNYRCIAAIRPCTNLRPSLSSRPTNYSGRDLAMWPLTWTNHPSGPLPKGRRLRLTKNITTATTELPSTETTAGTPVAAEAEQEVSSLPPATTTAVPLADMVDRCKIVLVGGFPGAGVRTQVALSAALMRARGFEVVNIFTDSHHSPSSSELCQICVIANKGTANTSILIATFALRRSTRPRSSAP